MQVTVRYFASIKDYTGVKMETIELSPDSTMRNLLDYIVSRYGNVGSSKLLTAVNGEYVNQDQILSEGDVVALFPPVSGG